MKDPKVSIIMSVYNGAKYLRKAINSILTQTFKDFEFIIINDASTDRTRQILEEYVKKDSRIVLVHNEKNLGLTKSLNKGLRLAKGEYIARMDADDISLPQRLEKQVDFLDNNPNVGLVGTQAVVIDRRGKVLLRFKNPVANQEIKEKLIMENQFIHSSVMFRKKCIEKVGCYREEFKCTQDYDLWLRISEQFDVANLEDCLCAWRLNPAGISMRKRVVQLKLDQIIRELAKERRNYRQDRLQRGESFNVMDETFINKKKVKKYMADAYFDWAKSLYRQENYFYSFKFLVRAILFDLFNKKQLHFLWEYFIKRGIKKIEKVVFRKQSSYTLNVSYSVSVIICTKDRPKEVLRCIDSVLKQSYLPKEIVVVDSSSEQILKDEIEKLQVKIPNIIFKYIHTTPGLTHQRNIGVKNAKGDIFLFLDDDLILEKNFIEEIVKVFNKYPYERIGGVMGNIVNAKNIKIPTFVKLKLKLFFLPEYGNGKFKISGATTNPIGKEKILKTEYLAGGLTAYRKDVFRYFIFDEDFFSGYAYLEDDDFSYRISRKYVNIYTPYARCLHFDSPNNRISPREFRRMYVQNFQYFFRKNIPQTFIRKVAFRIALFGIKHRVDQLPFPQIIALVMEEILGKKITEVMRKIYRKTREVFKSLAFVK